MIGAARWSCSSEIPAVRIMSGSASTTTYVSAAAKATATAARLSRMRDWRLTAAVMGL